MKDLIDLIDNSPTFNGHNQITISHISNKKLLKLFKALQEIFSDISVELSYCYSPWMEGQLSADMYLVNDDNSKTLYCTFDEITNTKIFRESGDKKKNV